MSKRQRSHGRDALRSYMKSLGWSNMDLARRAEIDPSGISRFLTGDRPLSRLSAIQIVRAMEDARARGETKLAPLARHELLDELDLSRKAS